MRDFFHSKLFVFILLILVICGGLMVLSAIMGGPSPFSNFFGSLLTPLQRLASAIGDKISSFTGYLYKYNSLVLENEQLKKELAEKRELEDDYYTLLNENEMLRELAGLKEEHPDYSMLPALVVSKPDNSLNVTFTLDKGTRDGVKKGDPVISGQGLVGYVSEVSYNHCEVTAITDMSSRISAAVSRTSETVVVEGTFELASKGLVRLSYLPVNCDLKNGDVIKTSGYGGIYPSGILIGEVVRIDVESHGMSNYAIVKPLTDFDSLVTVYVITDYGE